MNLSGLVREALQFADYSFERIFGVKNIPIVPLNRDISGLAVVYQGTQNSCVPCTITWVKQWYEKNGVQLSWPYLAQNSGTGTEGTKPSVALKSARKQGICVWSDFQTPQADTSAEQHKIDGYSYVSKLTPTNIYNALEKGPIAVGLDEYAGVQNHMVAAYDVTSDGQFLKCVNWWSESIQELIEVPFSSVTVAISFATIPSDINPTMPFLTVIKDKVASFLRGKPLIALLAIALGTAFFSGGTEAPKEQQFGQSGVALGYTTNVAAPGISSSVRSIPVSSITLYTGEVITTSTTIFPAYFVINPNGSTQELVECWGLTTTTTSPTWTDCNRGMSALGGPTTSTVTGAAFSHAAGERFVMTNAPPFFNRFLDIYTSQSATGTKRFTADLFTLGSGANVNGQKYTFHSAQANDAYIKALSNGATSTFYLSFDGISEFELNEDGTVFTAGQGISISGGSISINASTTAGLAFDSNGKLYVPLSTSGTLSYSPDGSLYSAGGGIGVFGDGHDGASTTVAGAMTLTRDWYFTNYTVVTGTTINTGGYRIFVSGTFTNNGVIHNDGGAGGAGGTGGAPVAGVGAGGLGGTTGTAGIASLGGYFRAGASGVIGNQGGQGGSSAAGTGAAGGVGAAGTSDFRCQVTTASAGSAGGTGGAHAGGTAGLGGDASAAGTCTTSITNPINNLWHSDIWYDITSTGTIIGHAVNPGSGGGSGGGGGAGNTGGGNQGGGGGGGGGSGGSGGVVWIAAKVFTNNWIIRAVGGVGGAGGAGGSTALSGALGAGGGGSGGAGGTGGVIVILAQVYTNNSTISFAGGAGGAAGAGGTTTGAGSTFGAAGAAGTTGATGKSLIFIP